MGIVGESAPRRGGLLCSVVAAGLIVAAHPGPAVAKGPQTANKKGPSAFRLGRDPKVRHAVPLEQVHKGIRTAGDPRDQIPPIDGPWFEPAAGSQRYRDQDRVLAFEHKRTARAYPLRVLTRHEVVNDMIDGFPFAIVFCPLCNTGSGFDRRVAGSVRRFGVSGYLFQSDVLLWDDGSESFWSQVEGKAVVGPETGSALRWLPVVNTTLLDFKARYPKGEVLVGPLGDRAYGRNPYRGWEQRDEPGLFMDPAKADRRLHQKAAVTGIVLGGEALCVSHERMAKRSKPLNVKLAGSKIRVTYNAANDVVTFERIGAKKGAAPLTPLRAYWFAWSTFHPKTRVVPAARDASM